MPQKSTELNTHLEQPRGDQTSQAETPRRLVTLPCDFHQITLYEILPPSTKGLYLSPVLSAGQAMGPLEVSIVQGRATLKVLPVCSSPSDVCDQRTRRARKIELGARI
jgi:hypothetical protein